MITTLSIGRQRVAFDVQTKSLAVPPTIHSSLFDGRTSESRVAIRNTLAKQQNQEEVQSKSGTSSGSLPNLEQSKRANLLPYIPTTV